MAYLPNTEFKYSDSSNLDAFGRLRISNPYNVFDVKLVNGITDIFFDNAISGGSLVKLTGDSANLLNVSGGSGSYVINQTKRRFNYQSGKSQLAYFTGIMSIETDVVKRIGLFESSETIPYIPSNGLYFETDGTTVSVNIVKNTTGETKITQTNWNLDKFDGSGGKENPSGIQLDLTKSQIFTFDFEWLGTGRVRFGFNLSGVTYYCHEVSNANNIVGVYMRHPNLPIRYEIRSIGGNGSLMQICSSISSEGGFEPNGIIRSITTTSPNTIDSDITHPLLAIKLKDVDKMIEIVPQALSAGNDANGNFIWKLKYYNGDETINRNGTPTAWKNIVFTGLTMSSIEYKNNFLTTDTVIAGQGIVVGSGISSVQGGGSISYDVKNALLIGTKLNGVKDVLVFEINNVKNNDKYYASISWREV